jgi:hypothetical protein
VVRDSVRKAWFAASQFFSGQGQVAQVALAVLQDRAHHIKAGPENSAVVRIRQARHVPVAIRHVRGWEALVQVDLRRPREDRHVRAAQHGVQASLISRGKKKAP